MVAEVYRRHPADCLLASRQPSVLVFFVLGFRFWGSGLRVLVRG